jgi:hypothetical protein
MDKPDCCVGSATKAEVNALLDVQLEDGSMDGFVFEIEVARRAFDHFDKVIKLFIDNLLRIPKV